MAMTKREAAEMESLREELRIARALRFTEPVERDLPPPKGDVLSNGYDHCGSRDYERVYAACSSSTSHTNGHHTKRTYNTSWSWSQNARNLYSTPLRAWKALRHELELKYAKDLAKVDREIEKIQQQGETK